MKVVVVDSDDSPLHQIEHELPGQLHPGCRICMLQHDAVQTLSRFGPRPSSRLPLKIAFGTPCPAIEAWYLCDRYSHNTEADWQRRLQHNRSLKPDRDQMKISVYGKLRLLPVEHKALAIAAGSQLVNRLTELERDFPGGFGTLRRHLGSW